MDDKKTQKAKKGLEDHSNGKASDLDQSFDFPETDSISKEDLWNALKAARKREVALEAELNQLNNKFDKLAYRLSLFTEHSTDVILLLDERLRVIFVSPSIEGLTGMNPSQIRQLPNPFDLLHPEDRPVIKSALQNTEIENQTLVFRVQGTQGTYIWTEANAKLFRDHFNNVNGFLVNLRNINELITNRKLLKLRVEQNSALLNLLPAAVFFKDSLFRYTQVNSFFYKIMGYLEPKDVIGKTDFDLLPEEVAKNIQTQELQLLKTGEAIKDAEYEVWLNNGKHFWVVASKAPYYDSAGQVSGIAGLIWDVSSRKQRELQLNTSKQQAEEASKQKNMFLANMSHEIRTPMNGIVGMVDLISQLELPIEYIHYIKTLKESAQHLLIIVNDILDLSRIEANRISIEHTPFELVSIVHEVLRVMNSKARNKGLRVTFNIDLDVPEIIIGDPSRLKQILYNMLANAIKFTSEGEVKLEVNLAGKSNANAKYLSLNFKISDTGCGIDPDRLPLIFEAFSQRQTKNAKNATNAGLGLAISKSLIEKMNGNIRAESTPGQGSTFYFDIPFEVSEKQPNTEHEQKINKLNSPTQTLEILNILLVEDSEVNQMVVVGFLKNREHKIDVAGSAELAIDLMNQHNYDLILMDIQLPEMSGIDLTKKIRKGEMSQTKSNVAIVALTAYAQRNDKDNFTHAGMDDYLSKPIQMSDLLRTVDNLYINKILPQRELHHGQGNPLDNPTKSPLVRNAISRFFDEETKRLQKVATALNNDDEESGLSIIFAFKNSALQAGFARLAQSATHVERLLDDGQINGAQALLDGLLLMFEKEKSNYLSD